MQSYINVRLRKIRFVAFQVSVEVYANPARMVSDTIASRAHCGIGVNQDVNINNPLFPLYGYTDKEVSQ